MTDERPGGGPWTTTAEWRAMMDPIHDFYAAKRGEPAEDELDEDEEDAVPDIQVIAIAEEVPLMALPQAARSVANRLDATGKWEVHAQRSATRHAPVLYKSDSKQGSAKDYQKGDVKTPAEEREHWGVGAVLVDHDSMTLVARLTATWETRKGKNGFSAAWTYDIVSGEGWAPKAGAFEEWLSVFAPKPPPKTKKKPAATEGDPDDASARD